MVHMSIYLKRDKVLSNANNHKDVEGEKNMLYKEIMPTIVNYLNSLYLCWVNGASDTVISFCAEDSLHAGKIQAWEMCKVRASRTG